MAPTDPRDAAKPARPFASLAELRDRHAELLRGVPADELDENHLGEVKEFLRRGAATGAYLDQPADRQAAQGLLEYWKATLYTQKRRAGTLRTPAAGGDDKARLPAAVLADFDEGRVGAVAAAAEECVRALAGRGPESEDINRAILLPRRPPSSASAWPEWPPELESVARGVLLRLVRLPEEGTAFTPVVLPREALLAGGEREKVQRVLEALQQAGALTVVRASRGAPESVRLSYEALLRLWPRLAGWLEKRVLFRDAALFWDKHNRDRGALFTGVLLEEAKPYQDLNALEREFVRACQAEAERLAAEQRRSTRRWQATAAVIAALLLLSLGCGYWAFASERAKQKATEAEKQASEKLLQTQRVANTAALLRTFGNLASAQSRVEEKLVQQRWNIIARRARDDPFLTAYIEQFGPTSPAWERVIEIKHSRRTFDQSVDQSSGRAAFLPVVRDLRKKLIESDDPEAVAQLTTLRTDYFDNVRFLSHEIVEAAEAGDSYASVVPLIQEFWRLYWWEMCLVEGKNVESTMVDFGKFLNEWKQRGERRPDAGWLKRLREQRELLVEALAKEQNQPLRPTP